MTPIVDPEKRGFIHGYAVAIGVLVRLHDRPVIAADLITQSGFTLRDFERAGLDDYDLKPVRKLFRTMRPLKLHPAAQPSGEQGGGL